MKKITFIILALIFTTSCINHKHDSYRLTYEDNYDSIYNYVEINKQGINLPTTIELPDTLYIQTEYVIAKEDAIIGDHVLHLKGDTLLSPGDSIILERSITKFNTTLEIKDSEIYIISDVMLKTCQINLEYKSRCIYSKTLHYFRDRNNMSLDFFKVEDGKYYYKAPLNRWESGHFDELNYMLVMYKSPCSRNLFDKNEIYLSKDDISFLLPSFKAYLTLQ